MPLSRDPDKRARQLANLNRGATDRSPAPPANARALKHGTFATIPRDQLDAEVRELYELLADLRRRVLAPAAEEAGAPWAGFHTFRHTCASLLFARGASAVQVQRWLGHHSPAFTLERYVHLLPGDAPGGLDLRAELGVGSSLAPRAGFHPLT